MSLKTILCLFTVLSLNQVFGLSVESPQWQAEVFNADFVGIVQCIKPGGDYRVVDGWKQSSDEQILKIHHVQYYHPVGKLFLVCVQFFNPEEYSKPLRSWDGFQSPFSWRVLPDTKYRGQFIELEYLEDRREAASQEDPGQGRSLDFFGLAIRKKNNFQLKQEIQRFGNQSLESQEYDVLLASLKSRSARDEVEFKQRWRLSFQSKKVEKLVARIFRDAEKVSKQNLKITSSTQASEKGQEYQRIIWPQFLGGGIHTLKALANIPLRSPIFHGHLQTVIRLLSTKLPEEELNQVTFYDLSPHEEFDALKNFVTQGVSAQIMNLQDRGEKAEATKLKKIHKRIANINHLNDLLRIFKTENKFSLNRFYAAGGRETFKWLKKNSTAKQFLYEKNILSCRLGDPSAFEYRTSVPFKTQLKRWERLLSGKSAFKSENRLHQGYELARAVEHYTTRKPALVAKFLKSFTESVVEYEPSGGGMTRRIITQSGFYLTSFFGHHCTDDRVKHLTALIDAKDPFVKAAAAIYLSFDQPESAIPILEEKTKLKGLPGAWVALALVRRGHSDYMTQALGLFKPYPGKYIVTLPDKGTRSSSLDPVIEYKGPRHELERCLKNHLDFLKQKFHLAPSNFKWNDAFPFQPKWNENRAANYNEMMDWWLRNKTIITDTRDPLIDELLAQKID